MEAEDKKSLGIKKIKKATVTESIIEQIKQIIEKGSIKPGVRFPSERELSELLSVSRSSVREAMKALHSLGIVEIKAGDGTYLKDNVNILSDHFKLNYLLKKYSILELIQARKVIEVEIAGMAAKNATMEMKNSIQEAFNETIEKKEDVGEFLKADFAFHLAIAEAAQNSFLTEMIDTIRDLLIDANYVVIEKQGQVDIASKSHQCIVEAILNNDTDKARKEMMYHLETIEIAIHEIFKENKTNKNGVY